MPIRAEGWAHLTQGRNDLEAGFKTLGIDSRLQFLPPGVATPIRG